MNQLVDRTATIGLGSGRTAESGAAGASKTRRRRRAAALLLLTLFAGACAGELYAGTPGAVVGWGNCTPMPDPSGPGADFVDILDGEQSGMALQRNGRIVCWGDNSQNGQVPSPNTNFIALSRCMGLKNDGSIVVWGDNTYGQCTVPSPNTNFIAIAGGGTHCLGLKSNGVIVAWGHNGRSQCNVPSPNSGFVAIKAVGNVSMGLKNDGSIAVWGYAALPPPSPNTNFIDMALALGEEGSFLGLKRDGSVVAWGGEAAGTPSPNSGFTNVHVHDRTPGGWHLHVPTGLKSDGSIVCWGTANVYGELDVPSPNTGFVALGDMMGLKSDGSLVAWGCTAPDGNYRDNRVSAAYPNSGFTKISAGYYALGLKRDGSITVVSGLGEIPSPNSDFTDIAAGDVFWQSLGLKTNGSVVRISGNATLPSPNTGFTNIAVGCEHSMGLKTNGSVVAWGSNSKGQCTVPSPNSGFIAIAAGGYHSLGLKSDGSVVAWGDNSKGQCTVPSPNSGFIAIAAAGSAGGYHSLGLKSDGSVVAWGDNSQGQCTVPSPNSGFTAIAANGWFDNISTPGGWRQYSLGLKSDGSVVAWGDNSRGQCTVPSPNSGFNAIAAGKDFSLAIKAGAGNEPPAIDTPAWASTNVVTLPDGVMVHVVAHDPNGDALTYTWTMTIGPVTPTFAGAADCSVTFHAPGDYLLRVTVSDGRGGIDYVTSDLGVTVKPIPGDLNGDGVVNALDLGTVVDNFGKRVE
jgi:hypothetical protein